jgi:hypothetical protein
VGRLLTALVVAAIVLVVVVGWGETAGGFAAVAAAGAW